MTVVALATCERLERGPGVSSMMIVVLVAGIGLVLAGLAAIGFGIPVKEFSFGNTLILVGAMAVCTGMIMLGLAGVVRELKNVARRLGPTAQRRTGAPLQSAGLSAAFGDQAPEDVSLPFSRDQFVSQHPGSAEPSVQPSASPPPWHAEAASRDRGRADSAPAAPQPAEAAPAPKARRNLLFSSSSRKERERAQARGREPSAPDPGSAAAPPAAAASEPPPATFEDAWPKSERSRGADTSPPRRGGPAPSTFTEPAPGAAGADHYPPAARSEDRPPVTVLKSGVVDGMAYSLYSDGSIEAQMPEGMMRFASIDELRAHLDQRP
jgi:hypothetical protein